MLEKKIDPVYLTSVYGDMKGRSAMGILAVYIDVSIFKSSLNISVLPAFIASRSGVDK